jgi:multidrug efflux pump subunit AcrA (membrane-fusion protein)
VWLVRPDNTVERRIVTVGASAGGSVEITAGLNGGEIVVVRASKALRDGAKVSRPTHN